MATSPNNPSSTGTIDKPGNAGTIPTTVAYVRQNPAVLKSVAMPFGEMPANLQNATIAPKADPVPTTDDQKELIKETFQKTQIDKAEQLAADLERNGAREYNHNEGEFGAQGEQKINDALNKNPKTVDEGDLDEQPEGGPSLWHLFRDAVGITAAAEAVRRVHHWLRDWEMLRRLRKAEKIAARAARESHRAKEAHEKAKQRALEAERSGVKPEGEHPHPAAETELERTGRELKISEKEAAVAAQEAARLRALARSARVDANFIRMRALLSVGRKTAAGFAAVRVLEAIATYATADAKHTQQQNVDEAMGVLLRSPFSKEAMATYEKDGLLDAAGVVAKDIWNGGVDTVKYVLSGDIVKDSKALYKAMSELNDLYKKYPEKARVFARAMLNDLAGLDASNGTELTAIAHGQLAGQKPTADDPNVKAITQAAANIALGDKELLSTANDLAAELPPPAPAPSSGAEKRRPEPAPVRSNAPTAAHPVPTAHPTDG